MKTFKIQFIKNGIIKAEIKREALSGQVAMREVFSELSQENKNKYQLKAVELI